MIAVDAGLALGVCACSISPLRASTPAGTEVFVCLRFPSLMTFLLRCSSLMLLGSFSLGRSGASSCFARVGLVDGDPLSYSRDSFILKGIRKCRRRKVWEDIYDNICATSGLICFFAEIEKQTVVS